MLKIFANALLSFILLSSAFFVSGQSYFQQEVDYVIEVSLNDETHTLDGKLTLTYTNNSPNTLNEIYFHLWPNAYKNTETALAKQFLENGEIDFHYATESARGFITNLDFKSKGVALKLEPDPKHIDIARLVLNSPLRPGESITMNTPFMVKIPDGQFSRLGHEEQAYQVTQWYPKPAVYDKDGWHAMPYLNQGEFYSEFGSFDVTITLPKNYVVGATGDLQTKSEIEWMNKRALLTSRTKEFDLNDLSFPESSKEQKTIRFTQKNVHDFAWFADKRFHVLKDTIKLPHSGREVTTWALFTNLEANLWTRANEYINNGIYYYSLWNGDYPYNQMTAVESALSAGAGMEYPNITVIGESTTPFFLEVVIVHEVGHNWFYGILGSNERDHPWMDEGINTYNEIRYIELKHPNSGLLGLNEASILSKQFDLGHYGYRGQSYLSYLLNARRNLDQPITTASADMTLFNYGAVTYSKTGLSFGYLASYLGQEEFDRAMMAYFEKWKYKHPQPNDLKAVLEAETGKNLDWFFDEMLATTQKVDYKLNGVKAPKQDGGDWKIEVKNKGQLAGPIAVSAITEKDTVTQWVTGFEGKQSLLFPDADYTLFKIDSDRRIPEYRRRNNTMRAHGLLKKVEPFKLQFFGSAENPNKTQLFWSPAIAWNNHDKTMLGIGLYNNVVPEQNFQFVLVPMYSFGGENIVGTGQVAYNMYPTWAQKVALRVHGKRFHGFRNSTFEQLYDRVVPELEVNLKRPEPRSPINQSIRLRGIYLHTDAERNTDNLTLSSNTEDYFYEFRYQFSNERTLNPFGVVLNAQGHEDFQNASIEATYRWSYLPNKKNGGLDIRLFAGKFFENRPSGVLAMWRTSGQDNLFDYTYEHLFFDRGQTSSLLSRQFAETHGALKAPLPGGANNTMVALNLKADLPAITVLPIGVFADAVATSDFGGGFADSILFDAGVHIPVVKGIFEVYFPLVYSSDISDYFENQDISFGERIRFTLHLERLNPFKFAEQFEL